MVTIYCDEHAIQKFDPSNPKEVKVSLRSDSMNEDFSSEMFPSVKISMGMYGHGSCMPWVCNFVLTLSEVCFLLASHHVPILNVCKSLHVFPARFPIPVSPLNGNDPETVCAPTG